MPKDTKTLGNNKARACESLGFVHKKRLCQRFDTTSFLSFYPVFSIFQYFSVKQIIYLFQCFFIISFLFYIFP